MSAQINLYHPRYLKSRERLTLANVGLAAGIVYAGLMVGAGWAWQHATERKEVAASADAQVADAKVRVEAATKAAEARKPSPQLIADIESAEATLRRRSEIAQQLESGSLGSSRGFSDFLRGFARQAQDGLWLTGFAIGAGGNDIEIRGRMTNAGALPEYIRRLGTEAVFQGRNFSALTMSRPDPAGGAPAAPASGAAPPTAREPIEFVLVPTRQGEAKEARP